MTSRASASAGGLDELPPELDVLAPARRSSVAPLLASVRPDPVLCIAFR
jgi:hypothetical protein